MRRLKLQIKKKKKKLNWKKKKKRKRNTSPDEMISLVYTSLVYWIVHYGEKKLLNFGQKPFFDCASPMGYNLILYLYCCFGAKVMIFLCSNSENWSMQYRSLGNNNILFWTVHKETDLDIVI